MISESLEMVPIEQPRQEENNSVPLHQTLRTQGKALLMASDHDDLFNFS